MQEAIPVQHQNWEVHQQIFNSWLRECADSHSPSFLPFVRLTDNLCVSAGFCNKLLGEKNRIAVYGVQRFILSDFLALEWFIAIRLTILLAASQTSRPYLELINCWEWHHRHRFINVITRCTNNWRLESQWTLLDANLVRCDLSIYLFIYLSIYFNIVVLSLTIIDLYHVPIHVIFLSSLHARKSNIC